MRRTKLNRPDGYCYTVQRGDTLESIAEQTGVSVNSILRANPKLRYQSALRPGQRIWIPEEVEE